MKPKSSQPAKINKVNLALDVAIFLAFLIATAPQFSGIPVHEWLGIAFGAAIVTHLLLHWQWLVQTTKRVFKNLPRPTRVNQILTIALFIDAVILTVSGLLISRVALPALGFRLGEAFSMRLLHSLSSDLGVFIIGLHVALHWKWIVSAISRHAIAPITNKFRPQRTAVSAPSSKA